VTIWADLHAPLDRKEPLASLSAALAVDLCGWRLDLAAGIARASDADLADPLGWLAVQAEAGVEVMGGYCGLSGESIACPLRLLHEGRSGELDRRLWRAQLAAIFPWLEEQRQGAIDRHRRRLGIDDFLRRRGITAIEDIELGGIARQLSGRIPRSDADRLNALSRMRNALAHRTPVAAGDLAAALAPA
jgi:hypothetical protein